MKTSQRHLLIGLLLFGLLGLAIAGAWYLRSAGSVVAEVPNTGAAGTVLPKKTSTNSKPLFDQGASDLKQNVETRLRFREATAESGIEFRHQPHRSAERYLPEIMGAGVLVGDFNMDGASDLILVNGGSVTDVPNRPADSANRLYINDGNGKFSDQTEAWKLSGKAFGMGGAVGDYDNDGWPDVFLTSYGGGDQLWRNRGDHFEDVTAESGIEPDEFWSTSAGFFDMDRDGDLDLYIVRYVDYTPEIAIKAYFNKVHVYATPLLYQGISDRLLRNNGDGTFSDVSATNLFVNGRPLSELGHSGEAADEWPSPDAATADTQSATTAVRDINACKGLALAISDIDNDGDPDLYIANDSTRNFLLINRGDGIFDEQGIASGVAYGETGREEAGMGIDFSDVNDDGYLDIACGNFQSEPTNIYCQTGGLFFVDRTDQIGVGGSSRFRLKFGIEFFDADNDGDEELLVATGHIFDQVDQFMHDVTFAQKNNLYERVGPGEFVDVGDVAGDALQDAQVSRGLASSDFDGDGRLDFVVANNGGTPQIARNETPDAGSFVSLWLEGKNTNRSAIGSVVRATVGGRTMRRDVVSAISYLSAGDLRVHLGLGDANAVDDLEIRWASGEIQKIETLAAGKFYRIVEGEQAEPYIPGHFHFKAH